LLLAKVAVRKPFQKASRQQSEPRSNLCHEATNQAIQESKSVKPNTLRKVMKKRASARTLRKNGLGQPSTN